MNRLRPPTVCLALLLTFAFAATTLAQSLPLPRSTPEAQGMASGELLQFITAADREIDAMHSFMLLRHGQVVAEGWWAPYAPEKNHVLYSTQQKFHVHRRRHGGRRKKTEH